jgi:glycosyltransferase involved in cell wall biosynthesis
VYDFLLIPQLNITAMRPVAIPSYIRRLNDYDNDSMIAAIRANYRQLQQGAADVSVVIPAFNEEQNILPTLLTISQNKTARQIEIIVVNNNSTDRTEELVLACGIKCVRETIVGPTAARNAGLAQATGRYMLNADADSIYPPDWIESMIPPLEDNSVAITYGRFAFLPSGSAIRLTYFLYENMADVLRWRKKYKEEAMNVYGCNSGFRREQCLQVNGYDHPPGSNEDGYLAIKLREKGFGRLLFVPCTVWTVDRHLQKDGGLFKAMLMRVKQAVLPG